MRKIPNFLLFSLAFSLFFLLFSNPVKAETIYPYWIDENLDVWTKVNLTANSQLTLYITKESGYSSTSADNIFELYDDFEDGTLATSGKWDSVTNYPYVVENSGLFASNYDLSITETSGYTQISGTGTKDTVNEDGRTSGHLGRGLRSSSTFDLTSSGYRIISKVTIQSTTTSHDSRFGFSFVTDKDNRFDWMWAVNWHGDGYGRIGYAQENADTRTVIDAEVCNWPSTPFTTDVEITFIPNGTTTAKFGSCPLATATSDYISSSAKVGFYATVRSSSNSIDARFHYFILTKYTDPEPSITIYDRGSYYEVVIQNNVAQDLTDYQIKLDGSQLGISSQSESLKISDTEPTSENNPPTIEISSPQNQTYYTTNLQLKFKVTDDNSTTFWVKAYFNNSLIYNNTNYQNNTEITIDLQPYLSDWMKTISVKVWANDTDQNNPQISEKTVYFTLDLYDFSFNFSNYTEFNNSKYAENLIYSYSARCGYLNHNATIKIYANNSEIYSKEFVCDNSTITYQATYKHSNEGLVNLTAKLLNYAGETKANQTYEYYNDLNPPIVDVSTTLHIGFFINYPQENATYNVTDTISPYVLCSYYFGNANGTDNITRANYSKPYNYTYNLIHGNNTLKVNCTDILNHSTEQILIQKAYLFQIKPIDEETGLYDTDLWTDVSTGNSSHFRFTSFDKNMNESFIFENISETIYLVLSTTKSWLMRFEQEYTDQIISNIYDLDYAPPVLYICVAADKPTVYQTAYSSVPIEGKAFAVTRSDTGCVKTISETQLIENGYGFNFYTMSGHYALWYIPNEFAWDQKTLLASFSGDAQITLDLEKALLLAQKIQEISIPSFNLLYISRYNNENATLIRYLSPETLSYFQINFTKEGEDKPFYTQTLTEASAIRLLLYWKNFDLSENDIIHVSYYAKFPDGRIDKGSIRTTPTGREIWFRWWECAIIMFMPMVLLFMRQLDWKNILAFSIIYIITAVIVLPHAEMHIVTQAYGLLGVVALFMAGIILIKKV